MAQGEKTNPHGFGVVKIPDRGKLGNGVDWENRPAPATPPAQAVQSNIKVVDVFARKPPAK